MAFQNILFIANKNSCLHRYKFFLFFPHNSTLKFLHRLPIFYRINFKICCNVHRALSLSEPFYLNTLLTHQSNTHSHHTTAFSPFLIPYFNNKSNGFPIFFSVAPFLWNHLPFALHLLTCH